MAAFFTHLLEKESKSERRTFPDEKLMPDRACGLRNISKFNVITCLKFS